MNKNKCKICGQHQWLSTNQPQWLVGLSLTPCSEADYVTDLLCSPATNCRLPSQIFITIDPAGPGCRLLFCYSRLWPQLSYEFLSDRLGARGGLLWPRYHAGLIRISGAARCPLRLMDHVVLIQSRGGGGMERRGSELEAEGRSDEERKIKKKWAEQQKYVHVPQTWAALFLYPWIWPKTAAFPPRLCVCAALPAPHLSVLFVNLIRPPSLTLWLIALSRTLCDSTPGFSWPLSESGPKSLSFTTLIPTTGNILDKGALPWRPEDSLWPLDKTWEMCVRHLDTDWLSDESTRKLKLHEIQALEPVTVEGFFPNFINLFSKKRSSLIAESHWKQKVQCMNLFLNQLSQKIQIFF